MYIYNMWCIKRGYYIKIIIIIMITRWADRGGWGGSVFNHVTRSRGCVGHVRWHGWWRFGGEGGALNRLSSAKSTEIS